MKHTKVKDIMTKDPSFVGSDAPIMEAARMMMDGEYGIIPVGSAKNIEGVITDRDIVIRAVAEGADSKKAKVADYMTSDVMTCSEEDSISDVSDMMNENGIYRVIVVDSSEKVTGIITFGKILRERGSSEEVLNAVKKAA